MGSYSGSLCLYEENSGGLIEHELLPTTSSLTFANVSANLFCNQTFAKAYKLARERRHLGTWPCVDVPQCLKKMSLPNKLPSSFFKNKGRKRSFHGGSWSDAEISGNKRQRHNPPGPTTFFDRSPRGNPYLHRGARNSSGNFMDGNGSGGIKRSYASPRNTVRRSPPPLSQGQAPRHQAGDFHREKQGVDRPYLNRSKSPNQKFVADHYEYQKRDRAPLNYRTRPPQADSRDAGWGHRSVGPRRGRGQERSSPTPRMAKNQPYDVYKVAPRPNGRASPNMNEAPYIPVGGRRPSNCASMRDLPDQHIRLPSRSPPVRPPPPRAPGPPGLPTPRLSQSVRSIVG